MGFWLLVPGVGMGGGTGPSQQDGRLEFTFERVPDFSFDRVPDFTIPESPDDIAPAP